MSTKFSYWYLKPRSGGLFPIFLSPPETPKGYLTTWFEKKPTASGVFPVDEAPISTMELIEAGLAAGYGKESTWSRTLLLGKTERAELYGYLRARLQSTLDCLDVTAGGVALKSFWRGVEPTEKAGLSFSIGSVSALIAARRWVQQYAPNRTVRRFLHARVFVDAAIVRHPLGKPASGESMPDYFVEDSAGEWHVFEAKGGDQGNRWKQLVQGVHQAQRIKRVGPVGAATAPLSAVCVQALVTRDANLELTLVDPPSETPREDAPEASDVYVAFVPALLEFSLMLDAVDWFHCLSDQLLADPWVEASRLSDDSVVARSAAFGGAVLSLPHVYMRNEESLREAARLLTTVAHLLSDMLEFNSFNPEPMTGQRLAQAAGTRLNGPDILSAAESRALRELVRLLPLARLPDGSASVDELTRHLPIGNETVGELLDDLTHARQEAERTFQRKRVEDVLWKESAMTDGGLAVSIRARSDKFSSG